MQLYSSRRLRQRQRNLTAIAFVELAGDVIQGSLKGLLEFGQLRINTENRMTGLDALQSVQFVTVKGKRLAVLDAENWEALIEWLETLEDLQIVQAAMAQLKSTGGDRQRAGWLKWDEVEQELE